MVIRCGDPEDGSSQKKKKKKKLTCDFHVLFYKETVLILFIYLFLQDLALDSPQTLESDAAEHYCVSLPSAFTS